MSNKQNKKEIQEIYEKLNEINEKYDIMIEKLDKIIELEEKKVLNKCNNIESYLNAITQII